MARYLIIGGILAVAMAVYAIVDLTITDDRRIRRLNRVLWAVLIVLVPVVGPLGWLLWGKAARSFAPPEGPEDSPAFRTQSGTWVSAEDSDRRIRELEDQLAALDDEELGQQQQAAEPDADEPDATDQTDHPDLEATDERDDGEPRRA